MGVDAEIAEIQTNINNIYHEIKEIKEDIKSIEKCISGNGGKGLSERISLSEKDICDIKEGIETKEQNKKYEKSVLLTEVGVLVVVISIIVGVVIHFI